MASAGRSTSTIPPCIIPTLCVIDVTVSRPLSPLLSCHSSRSPFDLVLADPHPHLFPQSIPHLPPRPCRVHPHHLARRVPLLLGLALGVVRPVSLSLSSSPSVSVKLTKACLQFSGTAQASVPRCHDLGHKHCQNHCRTTKAGLPCLLTSIRLPDLGESADKPCR
jgi:hypothetical protein